MSRELENKVAIVTGATSGIGLAIVELFASEGAKVVFCGRREEKGKAIEDSLTAKGYQAFFVRADATVDGDVENLVNQTMEKYGTIDILINNAGVLRNFSIETMDMKTDFDDVFNTNIRSYFLASKLAGKHMLEKGSGAIVNTASIGGLNGGPNITSYNSSKGAVILFTKAMAKEFGPRGIRVNSISPGLIYTEMMPRDSEFSDFAKSMVPLGRGAEPVEIAQVALFLVGDKATFVNGANIVVDGGASA